MHTEDRFRNFSSGFEKVLSELHDVSVRLASEHFREVDVLNDLNSELKSNYCTRSNVEDSLFTSFSPASPHGSINSHRGDTCSHIALDSFSMPSQKPSYQVEVHHDDVILQERDQRIVSVNGDRGWITSSSFTSFSQAEGDGPHSMNVEIGMVSQDQSPKSSPPSLCLSASLLPQKSVMGRFSVKECWVGHKDLLAIPCSQILQHAEAYWGEEDSENDISKRLEASDELANSTRHNLRAVTKKRSAMPKKSLPEQLVMHPFCKRRLVWSFLGLIFVLRDFLIVPIDVCFASDSEPVVGSVIQLMARVFWTIDIPVNFFTGVFCKGVLVLDLKFVACNYMRTWLALDVFLVTVEWFLLVLESVEQAQAVSIVRGVRWVRMFRVMRLLQLVRVTKMKPLLLEIFGHSSEDFKVLLQFVFCTLALVALAHVCACLWYVLGNAVHDGWVNDANVRGSVTHRYFLALQYFYTRMHGSHNSIRVHTTAEIGIDLACLYVCIIAVPLYTGLATHVVFSWANSDTAQLKKLAGKYVKRHRITRKVSIRTRNFLAACELQGIGEMLSDERKFLRKLPLQLQEDLQYEARAPALSVTPFLLDLNYTNPRAMRHLCYHAVSELMVVQDETLFAPGDRCNSTTFVVDGELTYRSSNTACTIRPKSCLSEAVLWTRWEHMGTLHASFDSLLLLLDAEKFAQSMISHKLALIHAVKYARVFVSRLHQPPISDLTLFDDLDLEDLDEAYLDFTDDESHLLFLSHYKEEAGTEASLMRDAFEQIIRMDPSYSSLDCVSPVFVDSEDLVDLARLKAHVEGSSALVLLLTPKLLTRPWCLLEIVIAFRNDLRIVPVEVQRPGIKYHYPNEEFYRKLEGGLILSAEDKGILESHDCTMREVVETVRHVFQKIALPFSPHKSWNIRQAELSDILKRCTAGAQLKKVSARAHTQEFQEGSAATKKDVRFSKNSTRPARQFRLFRPSMAFKNSNT